LKWHKTIFALPKEAVSKEVSLFFLKKNSLFFSHFKIEDLSAHHFVVAETVSRIIWL